MNILILGGFLGSGKTSVISQIAKRVIGEGNEPDKARVVVIENEIGEVGIDNQVLGANGYKVENMFSGCICCTMGGEIADNVKRIQNDISPELIIIEASGVGYPFNIKENILKALDVKCKICCVIDAKRWRRLIVPMGMILKDQLREVDIIIVNKTDLVEKSEIEYVTDTAKEFNSSAEYFYASAAQGLNYEIIGKLLGE